MAGKNEQPERAPAGTSLPLRGHTSRGLARYIRRQLAAARRSGDPRRIASAEAEITALRTAGKRARPTND